MWSSQTDPADGPTFYPELSNTALTSTRQIFWVKIFKRMTYTWTESWITASVGRKRHETDRCAPLCDSHRDRRCVYNGNRPALICTTHDTWPQPAFTDTRLILSSQHTTLANATTEKGWSHSIDSLLKKFWAHTFPPPATQSLYAICTLLLCLFWSVSIVLWFGVPCEGQSGALVWSGTHWRPKHSTANHPRCAARAGTYANKHAATRAFTNDAQRRQQRLTV